MNALDLDALLAAVSNTSPTGDDLEYDPDFLLMQQAAEGQPERQMGGSVVPAEEPNWRLVHEKAVLLLQRSKDLRIAVLLTRAQMHLRGLAGLREGLRLLVGLVSSYWADLHPRLDPDDGLDPSARVNALLDLCGSETCIKPLRATALIHSQVFGDVTLRDIEGVEGRGVSVPGAASLDAASLAGSFQACDLQTLGATTREAAAAIAEARTLERSLAEHISPSSMPDLSPLIDVLTAIYKALEPRLAEREPASSEVVSADVRTDTPALHSAAAMNAAVDLAHIGSREDVLRALDRLCDYYDRCEPSSPVPFLLKRARRLVTGSFVEILTDLAPDALPQVQKVCGIELKQ